MTLHQMEKYFNLFAPITEIEASLDYTEAEGNASVVKQPSFIVTGHIGGAVFLPRVLKHYGLDLAVVTRFDPNLHRDVYHERADEINVTLIEVGKDSVVQRTLAEISNGRCILYAVDAINENLAKRFMLEIEHSFPDIPFYMALLRRSALLSYVLQVEEITDPSLAWDAIRLARAGYAEQVYG